MNKAAIHEAGHCIVGLSFGWRVSAMRIAGTDSGSVLWESEETLDERWLQSVPRARRALCVTVAGQVAEGRRVSTALNALGRLQPSFEDDYRAARQAFAICSRTKQRTDFLLIAVQLASDALASGIELSPSMMDEIDRAERRAERILKRCNRVLAALADALHKGGLLTWDQINTVLRQQHFQVAKGTDV
jgi:hypothetical protein